MTYPHLMPLDELNDAAKQGGCYAQSLQWLKSRGFGIAPSWVLTAEAFGEFVRTALPPGHDPTSLSRLSKGAKRSERAARALERVSAASLPDALQASLEELSQQLAAEFPLGLRLSASPTLSDTTVAELSGLGVAVGGRFLAQELLGRIRQLYGRMFLPETLDVLGSKRARGAEMAVVIQPQLAFTERQTLFTGPPAGFEGYWPNHQALLVDRRPPKQARWIPRTAANDGPEPPDPLTLLAASLEESAGYAAAVDVAKHEGQWLVLKRYPLKGAGHLPGGNRHTVWGRALIGEVSPNLPSPLTGELLERFVDDAYQKLFEHLGASTSRSRKLTVFLRGRPYLNLTQMTKMASQIPAFDRSWLVSFSGDQAERFTRTLAEGVGRRRYYARLPFTAKRLLGEQLRLKALVKRRESELTPIFELAAELDLGLLPDDALVQSLRQRRRELGQTLELMLQATSAFYAAQLSLHHLLKRRFPVEGPMLARSLGVGRGSLESANACIALARVAQTAAAEPAAAEEIATGRAAHPGQLPSGPTRRALHTYLVNYGHLAPAEAELLSPRFLEDPRPLFEMLCLLLQKPELSADGGPRAARAQADADLGRVESRLPWHERQLVTRLLAHTRSIARLRDRVRTWISRHLAQLRFVALEIDERLRRVDDDLEKDAVFFCTTQELEHALATGRPELARTVRWRRASRRAHLSHAEPPPLLWGTPPFPRFPRERPDCEQGSPISPGVVRGRARVVSSWTDGVAEMQAGEILVVPSLDPAFAPVAYAVAGIIAERGGPFSPAAAIAKELGVPMVAHIPQATEVIRTGDEVRMDGYTGTVEILTNHGN